MAKFNEHARKQLQEELRKPRNARVETGLLENPYGQGLRGREYLAKLQALPPEERHDALHAVPELQRKFCELALRDFDERVFWMHVNVLEKFGDRGARNHYVETRVEPWLRTRVTKEFVARWERRRRTQNRPAARGRRG